MESASENTDEWIPKYRNDSRQWIVCEEDQKNKWEIPNSTSKSTFVKPDENDFRPLGRRKKLFHRFFLDEVQLEPAATDNRPTPTYRTEYMENFNKAQTKEDKASQNNKSEQQFPLYTSEPAVSFWQQNIDNIPGLTKPCHPKHLFHKNTFFTKPINEVLDNPFAKQNAEVKVDKWHQLHFKFGYK